MTAMHEFNPSIQFEIFTKVPKWFFQQSLSVPFIYHSLLTDIGLVQKTPLGVDLPGTFQCLNDFLPFDHFQITSLAEQINNKKCQLIICDIAPMGITVAQAAKIPSILVENFTWDWLYEGYIHADFQVDKHINYLREIFASADYVIQTEPVCHYRNSDLTTLPVSRNAGTPSHQVRQKLGIPDNTKAVLITMGGIREQYGFLKQLTLQRNIYFIIPGSSQSMQLVDNLALLPHHSDFFHPDLINACDVVIGKLGYSTLAETYYAGVPFGYITRPKFRESGVLETFIKKQMSGCAIMDTQFQDGSWTSLLPDLISLPRTKRSEPNGAIHVARFICKLLNRDKVSFNKQMQRRN